MRMTWVVMSVELVNVVRMIAASTRAPIAAMASACTTQQAPNNVHKDTANESRGSIHAHGMISLSQA